MDDPHKHIGREHHQRSNIDCFHCSRCTLHVCRHVRPPDRHRKRCQSADIPRLRFFLQQRVPVAHAFVFIRRVHRYRRVLRRDQARVHSDVEIFGSQSDGEHNRITHKDKNWIGYLNNSRVGRNGRTVLDRRILPTFQRHRGPTVSIGFRQSTARPCKYFGDTWDVEVSGVIPINTSTVKGQLLLYVSTTTTNFLLHLCEPDTFVPSNTVEQHFTARIKLMVTETNSLFASVTTFLSLSSGQTTFYMSQDTAMTNLDTEILSVELLLKTDTAFSSTGMVEQKCFTSRLNFNV
jgi:hypothetical protein